MNDGRALIVQGDALHLPLPDESVDLIVSSPPYWSLRAYSAGPGEIGSEPTPQAFLEALWAATAEMMRVLKPTGSIFVDLGDKYNSRDAGNAVPTLHKLGDRALRYEAGRGRLNDRGYPAKSLMLLPERYRIGAVDRLGLICRSVIVWDKPNGLPESVTDRVRRSHEDWVHLVKQPRYYSATDEIREASQQRPGLSWEQRKANGHPMRYGEQAGAVTGTAGFVSNPLGKLPGSVWSIPSEPLRLPDHLGVQHYAAFPSEWPRRLILGFSPNGICVECGQGRVPVVEREYIPPASGGTKSGKLERPNGHPERFRDGSEWSGGIGKADLRATILGYACSCTPHTDHPGSGESSGPQYSNKQAHRDGEGIYSGAGYANAGQGWGGKAGLSDRPKVGPWREYHLDRWTPPPTRPAVVCDPFSGTGTTPMVARALGRIGVGVDLSHAYCRAARWRVKNDGGKAISRTWTERQTTLL